MSGPWIAAAGNRPALRISLFYTAFFGTTGIVQPYFPVWLAAHGLEKSEIGMLVACTIWVRVIANPWIAQRADFGGGRKRTVVMLSAAGALAYACYLPMYGFWQVLPVAILGTLCVGPVLSLADNIVLLTAKLRGLDYGRMRLWGSGAFIVTSVAGGAWMAGRSADVILYLMIAGYALSAAGAMLLPDARAPSADRSRPPIRILIGKPLFLLAVFTAALNMSSHAILTGFATLHWQAAGLSTGQIGFLWGWGVVSEVALFWLAAGITARLGVGGLFALGAVAGMIRWTGTALTTDFLLLLPLQALHGITFGATHLGAMRFLQTAIPPQVSATAQGLHGAISMGLVSGLTQLFSGHLYEALGGHAFLVMVIFSFASLLLSRLLVRVWREGTPIA
jgi:PPP family 3-phenylpropionic acid transporter